MKIALLTEIPAPYRVPLFNALADVDDVELHVHFLRDVDPRRPHYRFDDKSARFNWSVLRGHDVIRGGRWVVVTRGLTRALARDRPDIVLVGGWAQPAFWQALALAALRRRPAVAWVESTSRDERSGAVGSRIGKRLFLRACSGAIVPGSAAAEYVHQLGLNPEVIAVAPNAVEETLFSAGVDAARLDRDDLRTRLGIEGICVLCVGRLEPEKDIGTAVRAIAASAPEISLVVAGAGSEEPALRELADAVAPGRVRFLGFRQPAELVEWYAAADIYVLPSRSEQWGMTLNEAALAGLPLVASEAAGGAHDLVEDGFNGFRVEPGNSAAFASAFSRLAADPTFRLRAGMRSRALISGFTPECWAAEIVGLARKLLR